VQVPPTPPQSARRVPTWLAVTVALLAGGFMATQSRINGELSGRIDDAPLTALISFGSGTIILLVYLVLSRRTQNGFRLLVASLRERRTSWVFTLAGASGAAFVFSQSLVVGITGVALFSITFVCGLTIGSYLLDATGIGPAGRKPFTTRRTVGVLLAIVAVSISMLGRLAQADALVLLILPFVFGVLVAWQQIANGTLAVVARTPLTPTALNFLVGTGVLAIVAGIYSLMKGLPETYPTDGWLYLGGLCGVFFVSMTAWAVRHTGALVTSLATTTGQILTAVLADIVFPQSRIDTFSILAGACVMVLALTVAAFGWKTRPLRP
jgi:transporter family-2 protein